MLYNCRKKLYHSHIAILVPRFIVQMINIKKNVATVTPPVFVSVVK